MESVFIGKPSARLVYTIAEVSRILGISENSIRKAIKAGTIPHKRIGGRVVIPIRQFNEIMGI